MQDAKSRQKSQSGHHLITLSGYIFTTETRIDNRKKFVKQQYVLQMSPQYGELRFTSGWDRFVSLGHLQNFNCMFRVLHRYCTACSSGHQPNCTALNRGRHLCSARRPSRWALAHISSGDFLRAVLFLASRAQHVSDLHSKFALMACLHGAIVAAIASCKHRVRPHHVWSMV